MSGTVSKSFYKQKLHVLSDLTVKDISVEEVNVTVELSGPPSVMSSFQESDFRLFLDRSSQAQDANKIRFWSSDARIQCGGLSPLFSASLTEWLLSDPAKNAACFAYQLECLHIEVN